MHLNREWNLFTVHAIMEDSVEHPWPNLDPDAIQRLKDNIAPHTKSHIYTTPNPIICKAEEILDIIDFTIGGKRVRIYPPFKINGKNENAGAFENVWIPEGKDQVGVFRPIPESTVKAFNTELQINEETHTCHGLRIDAEDSAPLQEIVNNFLAQVCQFTYQYQ